MLNPTAAILIIGDEIPSGRTRDSNRHYLSCELTKIGIGIIALGGVLEVLFKGTNIPFWPEVSVVDNIMGILGSLSAEGLVGLVGAFVLYHIIKK